MKKFIKQCQCSYVIIPLIVLGVSLLGQHFTAGGMERYATLQLPNFTPPGRIIGLIRTIIFVLATVSAILFWHKSDHDKKFGIAISLFADNAVLNVLRSRLFFTKHLVGRAIVEMIVLWIFTVMLIIAVWTRTKLAAYLLMPYALWLIVATYFAINIYLLN